MSYGEKERLEFIMYEKVRTEKAILVFDEADFHDEANPSYWLPLSQITIEESNTVRDQVTVWVPEWLAKKNGLI